MPDSHQPDAVLAGEVAGQVGGAHRGDRAERRAAVDAAHRARPGHDPDRVPAARHALHDPLEVGGQPVHAVGVEAAQVRVDQHVGHDVCVRRSDPDPAQARCGELVQRVGGDEPHSGTAASGAAIAATPGSTPGSIGQLLSRSCLSTHSFENSPRRTASRYSALPST